MNYAFAFRAIHEALLCIEKRLQEMGGLDTLSRSDRIQLQRHYRMLASLITVTFAVSPIEEDFAINRVFVGADGRLLYDLEGALKAREAAFPVVTFGPPRFPS